MPIAAYPNGGNSNNQHSPQQPRRTSKFPGLRGFVQLHGAGEVPLEAEPGQLFPYAKVGSIFYIDQPSDNEIDDRIFVVVRTNIDSWSCFGFCRNKDRDECENPTFKAEHAPVTSDATTQANSPDDAPRVMLKLRDAWDNVLEVDGGIWINCRQILDIKHTVSVASIGSIHKDSLTNLLQKGLRVFNRTFADLDKKPPVSNAAPAAGTLPASRPPVNGAAGPSSRPAPNPVPSGAFSRPSAPTSRPGAGTPAPAPLPTVVRPRGGSGRPEPKARPKLGKLDRAALKFMMYAQT